MKKVNEIKVIIKEPGKEPEVKLIANTLEAKQQIVGGYIQVVPFTTQEYILICNEEGKLEGLKPNIQIPGDIIVGTVIVVKDCGEEFGSVNKNAIPVLENLLKELSVN